MSDEPYVIWSFEHRAWWAPDRWGYTLQLAQAGHYVKAEADQIVADANIVEFNEQTLPSTTAQAHERQGWHPLSPGAYEDGRGGLHLVLPEMLAVYGCADTPENRQVLIDAARAAMGADKVQIVE